MTGDSYRLRGLRITRLGVVTAWLAVLSPSVVQAQAAVVAEGADQVDVDFENALARLHQAAQAGHLAARDKLAALAHQGIPAAQFRLGQLHYESQAGAGGDRGLAEAIAWWLKASSNGYGRASMALANLYDHGEAGVAADAERALHYYELTVVQGWVNPTSQTRLARALLRNGQGKDCTRIGNLLRAASATGFPEALQLLNSDAGYKALCGP